MGLWAIIILVIGVFVIAIICGVVQGQKESSPENQAIKKDKQQQLQKEVEAFELAKIHTINTQILERYCVGISPKTKYLIIYKPIRLSTDDIFIKKIPFESIIGCEILEDNETIQKGGVGRAVIGGVLAGGVGAIVGATTRPTIGVINSLKIKIILNDVLNPYYEITIIQSKTERISKKYKELYQVAQEIYSTIVAIEESNKADVKNPIQNKAVELDSTEILRKYKQLLDDGIITQEEFELKKKQLLGL